MEAFLGKWQVINSESKGLDEYFSKNGMFNLGSLLKFVLVCYKLLISILYQYCVLWFSSFSSFLLCVVA